MPRAEGRVQRGRQNFKKGGGRAKCLDLQLGEQDEYFDEDAFENYVDMIDDDDSCDEIVEPSIDYEGVADIDIEAVQESIVQSEKRWREVGNNSNRRGAGTSKSTYKRIKKKAADKLLSETFGRSDSSI